MDDVTLVSQAYSSNRSARGAAQEGALFFNLSQSLLSHMDGATRFVLICTASWGATDRNLKR